MKFLKALLALLAALAALFVAIGLFLPQTARVERSITTAASAATVFGLVNGFQHFNEWSPWAGLDPATRYTYSGPAAGVGARMEWRSEDPNVGNGSQEVVAVVPDRSVTSTLDFGLGYATTATITLLPEAAGTRVTWTLDTDFANSIVGRYFGLALDRMVGPDYERGLAQLKRVAEARLAGASISADNPAQAVAAGSPSEQDTPVPPSPQ
jgi:uncharacterized protein YndB with AHSA1/START domain